MDFSSVAFVFPGQGSQAVGMGKDVADAYPIAKETLSQADEIIGFDLSQIMFEGTEDELSDTAITQPAMYVCSIAMFRVLESKMPDIKPAFVAGHSLGEFTALTVAGALSFEDGVKLVRERGRLMKEAGEKNPGGMAALLGITSEKAEELVNTASEQTGKPLVIANDNCPGQIVISGDAEALNAAVAIAKEYGARRVLSLPVSVATHSPLMQPAKEEFVSIVQATNFETPKIPIYANVTAKPINTVEAIRDELEAQLTSSVLWTQSMNGMITAGIETFVEVGSKDVLTGLLKRIDKSKTGITINSLETLEGFLADNS